MASTAATGRAPEQEQDEGAGCSATVEVLGRIGDKWTLILVGALGRGSMRFNQLMRATPGISHRMLTIRLRSLERDGLVKRTAFATIPPRVDYELTELGRSLIAPLLVLSQWALENRSAIKDAQDRYDTAVQSPQDI